MRHTTRLLAIVCWGVVVAAGAWQLEAYADRAGTPAVAPAQWPAGSHLHLDPHRATLVLLAHPQCPCTAATMSELALLMARGQGRVTAYVLFVRPQGMSIDWVKSSLWATTAAIPGVTPLVDEGGAEASRFGAATSGQVLLYDRDGRLRFGGGITSERGHEGDNEGLSAVVALVNGETPTVTQAPVYGCPLCAPGHQAAGRDAKCLNP